MSFVTEHRVGEDHKDKEQSEKPTSKNSIDIDVKLFKNERQKCIFPCSYENVICVGAVDNRGDLTDFSNHGSKVDIVAPGESIVSTYPGNIESRVLRIKNYDLLSNI